MTDFDLDVLLFGTKRCPACGRDLPASEEHFHRDAEKRDGLTIWCKECRNAATRRRYWSDPAIRASKAAWARRRREVAASG